MMYHAALSGNIELVMFLDRYFVTPNECNKAFTVTPQTGDLKLVQWFSKKVGTAIGHKAVYTAVKYDKMEILEWLLNERPRNPQNIKLIQKALNVGHLHMADWLLEKNFHHSVNNLCIDIENLAAKGQLASIEWCLSHNLPMKSYLTAMISAAKKGHFHIVKWLHNNESEGGTSSLGSQVLMDNAAKYNDFDMLKWLHQNRTEGCTNEALHNAAINGNVEMFRFIESHYATPEPLQLKNYTYVQTCGKGHLEMIKYMHNHRSENIWSAKAMDEAAENGHLEVVKFLHYNRTEGCSKEAVNKASENGHLDVIKFLHENRTEGCTYSAIDYAVYKNNMEVVKYLIENLNVDWHPASIITAITDAYIDIADYLMQHPPPNLNIDEIIKLSQGIYNFGKSEKVEKYFQNYINSHNM